MTPRILVAGIGNIFHGDDAFGVRVAQSLLEGGTAKWMRMPGLVRVMDVGIRTLDLAFALLDTYDVVILIDAMQRGGAPGTLYTIEIRREDIPDAGFDGTVVNSHSLDPVRVISLARSLGARLNHIVLVACEPEILDCTDTGHIGLSVAVEASVAPAMEIVRSLCTNSLTQAVS